jgi:uncharacterized protein YdaU (DUF1376 family)
MSPPPYMPLWIGDYLRDTQHLTCEQHGAYLLLIAYCWEHDAAPQDDASRALITRQPLKRWQAMKATILAFFEPDGTHRRVKKERARAAHLNTVRAAAGTIGGLRSAANKRLSKNRSPPKANGPPNSHSNITPNAQQKSSVAEAYQNQKEILTESPNLEAARATPAETHENQDKSAGSLATALDGGALTRPPFAEQETTPAKPPSEVSRAEWDRMFAAKRGSDRLDSE